MAVLGPIIEAVVRPIVKAGSHVAFAALVGAQLVSDDPLGSKTTALHQRHE